jgi:integrase
LTWIRRAKVRLDVWTKAQMLLFLSEAKARSPYYPVYLTLVGTGARVGEVFGLMWSRVSRDAARARFSRCTSRRGVGIPRSAAITKPERSSDCGDLLP